MAEIVIGFQVWFANINQVFPLILQKFRIIAIYQNRFTIVITYDHKLKSVLPLATFEISKQPEEFKFQLYTNK